VAWLSLRKYLSAAAVGAVVFVWSSIYWLGPANLWQVEKLVSLDLPKPWVYRQLTPMLARLLSLTGLRIDLALVLIVTISGIGFYLALRELIHLYYGQASEIIIVASVFAGLLMFGYDRLPYDLTTAFLFSLALVYIAKGQTENYMMLFPLVCLNRETAFLLILLYAVYKPHNVTEISYQVGVYALVMIVLRAIFADNGGVGYWIEPMRNIQRFINHPIQTLIHLTVMSAILFMVFKGWKEKPYFLRLAFMIFAPVLTGMYLIFGQAFEVRTLWEVYPVTVALCYPKVIKWIERIKWNYFSTVVQSHIRVSGGTHTTHWEQEPR
jgi:hypothetical protein